MMEIKKSVIPLGGVYLEASQNFQRGLLPELSRTLKATKHDAGVVEEARYMGNNETAQVITQNGCVPVNEAELTSGPTLNKGEWDVEYRIRKLTPLECWRLQGFSDEDFTRAKWMSEEESKQFLAEHPNSKRKRNPDNDKQLERMSNAQLYKQAGNSICVNVLYYIYLELYKAMPYLFDDLRLGSFFSGIGAFETALDKLFAEVKTDV